MENIDKKSAIKALVEKGKAVGKLTTQEIDNAMLELDIDIEELDKLYELIEANNIIDRLTKHPVPIEFPSGQQKPWKTCTSWSDCTNPHKDCINCPLRYKQSDFANTWSNKQII